MRSSLKHSVVYILVASDCIPGGSFWANSSAWGPYKLSSQLAKVHPVQSWPWCVAHQQKATTLGSSRAQQWESGHDGRAAAAKTRWNAVSPSVIFPFPLVAPYAPLTQELLFEKKNHIGMLLKQAIASLCLCPQITTLSAFQKQIAFTMQMCKSMSRLGAECNGKQGIKNSYRRPQVWAVSSSAAVRAWSGFGRWSSSSSGLWLGCPRYQCQHLVTGDLQLKTVCSLYFDLVGWPSGPAPWNLAFDFEEEKYILFHSSITPLLLFSIVWISFLCTFTSIEYISFGNETDLM